MKHSVQEFLQKQKPILVLIVISTCLGGFLIKQFNIEENFFLLLLAYLVPMLLMMFIYNLLSKKSKHR